MNDQTVDRYNDSSIDRIICLDKYLIMNIEGHTFIYLLIYYYHYTPCGFFTPTLADGLSLGFERQQVSLGPKNCSQYSSRSQRCSSRDGFASSSKYLGSVYYYYHYYYHHFTLLRVFPIRMGRWSSTGVWVTVSFLKSPGLFSVFLML